MHPDRICYLRYGVDVTNEAAANATPVTEPHLATRREISALLAQAYPGAATPASVFESPPALRAISADLEAAEFSCRHLVGPQDAHPPGCSHLHPILCSPFGQYHARLGMSS
ncbi:hypothetical protein NDU88_004531 [Pleurodeles waltl]|uniref:Uncharacterized protein n=1 Tax=Pleurodeles waltl TaxID=8319 RepID=A0AAV7SJ65_PLEWA|nr:hypothetical protein NDU88_004531 [Pleurodeles waltl]